MSLATTGGGMGGGAGAGGGAMTMAHHAGPNAVQVARQAGTQGGGHTRIDGASGQAPPSNLASLAADQLGDKRLQKLAKNTLHLPIVGVDLGGQTHVCYQPPIAYEDSDGNLIPYEDNEDDDGSDDDDEQQPQGLRLPPATIVGLGKGLGSDLLLKKTIESDLDGTASAYKTARKLLTKGTNQTSFLREHPIQSGPSSTGGDDNTDNNESILTLPRPHSVLGVRRIQELDTSLQDYYNVASSLEEEDNGGKSETSQAINPISSDLLQDQALDGSNPKGDDYDRVSFVSRLHPQKKPLTILPEEAVGMLLLKSKQLVHEKMMEKAKQELANNNNNNSKSSSSKSNGKKKKGKNQSSLPTEEGEEDKLKIVDYGDDFLTSVPIALAIPGYATCDSSIEAYKEVIQSSSSLTEELVQDTAVLLFPRSACAITAAMYNLVNPSSGKVLASKLFGMFLQEHKLLSRKASQLGEPSEGQHVMPLLVTVGVTCEGYEICSILLQTDMQHRTMPECAALPLEEYRYLHCQCSRFDHVNPSKNEIQESIVESLKELKHDTQITVGKSRTPFAILIYGDTLEEMHQLETMIKDSNVFDTSNMSTGAKNETLNTVLSREDGVAFGTALMAASACGRTVSPSVNVMTVCTSSVGLKISYSDKVSTIKTIFDFDRRLPAGPYEIEFSALEAAAVRLSKEGLELLEDTATDDYEKALKPYEGKKGIPQREEAALALTVQLVQQSERGGEWIPLGDAFQPLVCEKEAVDPLDDDKKDKESDNRIACETSTLELKLRPEGIVVTGMDQHGGISVRQALKNSFWNTIYFYLTVLGCIAFFGGFLVKSYWEDYTFQRDTKRVLAYYKRAIPGSMHDGDEHGARYLVYKYRHKKAKLWTRLEKKYDYPIPENWDTFVEEVFEEIRIEKLQRQEEAEARGRGEWDGGSSESKKNDNVEEENLDEKDAPPKKEDPRKSTTTPVDDDDDEDHEL